MLTEEGLWGITNLRFGFWTSARSIDTDLPTAKNMQVFKKGKFREGWIQPKHVYLHQSLGV